MDYYNEKYERYCINQSTEDSVDKAVDIVIKGNKIYKVTNYNYRIETNQLDEIIDEFVIDRGFVLESSHNNLIYLYQKSSDSYVVIKSHHDHDNKKYYEIELVVPVKIGNTQ
jgi:hypothetical protein